MYCGGIVVDSGDPAWNSVEICGGCRHAIHMIDEATSILDCKNCTKYFHSECWTGSLATGKKMLCSKCYMCQWCNQKISLNSEALRCKDCKRIFHQDKKCGANEHEDSLDDRDLSHWRCIDCLQCKYCKCKSPLGTGWSDMKEVKQKGYEKKARWMNLNTTCYECHLVENARQQCPVCKVLFREDDVSLPMIVCDQCEMWVHLSCDKTLTKEFYDAQMDSDTEASTSYTCPSCTDQNESKRNKNADEKFSAKNNENKDANKNTKPMSENEKENCQNGLQSAGMQKSYGLLDCIICGRGREYRGVLQQLSPFDYENVDDCVTFLTVPDLFVHQSCLYYVAFENPKLLNIEPFIQSGQLLYQSLVDAMQADCMECLAKGPSVFCKYCDGYVHPFCVSTHSHSIQMRGMRKKKVAKVVLNRRFLSKLLSLRNIHFKPADLILKTNFRCFKVNTTNYDTISIYGKVDSKFVLQSITSTDYSCSRLNTLVRNKTKQIKIQNQKKKPALSQQDLNLSRGQLIVAPSPIAGVGVSAAQVYLPGDCVVEYVGEVIGKAVANKREKMYELQKRGCYMFKLEEDSILDATMTGNQARFINHSCQPNCKARIMPNNRQFAITKKRIVIGALRRIEIGEELCYDYMFPREDAKIPCRCGAPNCRGYMN